MKDSESHGSKKQVLQRQAEAFLPLITSALSKLDYKKVAHQRISQQNSEIISYQGLTRAVHDKFGQVIIKWQVSSQNLQSSMLLNHEIAALEALNKSKNVQKNAVAIAVKILTHKMVSLNVLKKNQLLTLLVMPHYSQGSLLKYPKQPLTDAQKYQVIMQSAQLIANLHNNDWLHNDIKPSNILISNNNSLLLTDFALAEPIDSGNEDEIKAKHSAGTPAYLAPERWQGQGATVQSDIYAFGVMMYEILLGERPFVIDSSSTEPKVAMKEWAIQHCQSLVAKLPKEYQHYQQIINKALAKQMHNRYQDMQNIITDLQALNKR